MGFSLKQFVKDGVNDVRGAVTHASTATPKLPQQNQPGFGVVRPGAAVMPQQQAPSWRSSVLPSLKAVGTQASLGTLRVGSGLAQDASGLVDLATPGKGTSRVTKGLSNLGKQIDQTAAAQPAGAAHAAYKIAQGAGTAATFLTPGGIAKGAAAIPKVAHALDVIKPGTELAGRGFAPAAKFIAKGADELASHGAAGRIAGATVRGGLSHENLINSTAGTVGQIGNQASKGQKITPGGVGLDAATNVAFGAGLSGAGQGFKEVLPGVKVAAKALANEHGAALNRNAAADGAKSQIKQLTKEVAGHQKQLDALPIDAHKPAEVLQRKIDTKTGMIANLKSQAPQNAVQKVTDRLLTSQPGFSMQAVHDPALTPQQNDFIEQYAEMKKSMGEGNGVNILPNGTRTSNNYRAPGMGSGRQTNADWFNQARQEIESGKGAYGASDEYKALSQPSPDLSTKPVLPPTDAAEPNYPPLPTEPTVKPSEASLPQDTPKVSSVKTSLPARNANAERQALETLKNGGTNDAAVYGYMKSTGKGFQDAVKDVRRASDESGLSFAGGKNPLLGSVKLPEVQAGDHHQAFLNADFVKQHERAIGQNALDSFHNLSEHDKTLLKGIETDTVSNVAQKADNPEAFGNAEKQIRTYYDTRHAYDNALGIDVGYRANYLRQIFDKAEQNTKDQLPDQIAIKAGNKKPGYTQQRSNETLNTEVGNALERDIHGSSTNHAKLAYSEGLQQAYPGKVNASGQLVRDDTGAYKQITNKYGEAVTAQKDIADAINSRARVDTQNKFLQKYDKANAGIKYAKLGGGTFHALTEAGNFAGQQLTSGKLFTEPSATGKVIKTFFSPKTMEAETAKFRANGTLDNAALSGLKTAPHDILGDADVNLGGKIKGQITKYTGLQALHDATFQREIPYAKLKLFEQKTKSLDVQNPADLAKMRSVSDGINNLFGGINRDIQGIRPKEFQALQRFVLATDFTEGKIKTALRAVNITSNTPAAKVARQAVIGKALLFGALVTGAGAATGEFKGKSPKQIALNVLGKLADPKFQAGKYSVSLPATHISEFSKPLSPLFRKDGGDRFSGLQRYGTNRLAAIPSELLQLKTNKDANGNRIYGKDYAFNGGNKISPAKTALNIAGGFTPIPASQAITTPKTKAGIATGVANTLGLRVSNEDTYNQNATPVKITQGNTSTTLTGKDAIAYNKAVADKKTALDTQLKASSQYKSASADQQKSMLTKLHGDITDNQKRQAATAKNIPLDKQANAGVQAVQQNKLPTNLGTKSSRGTAINSKVDKQSTSVLTKYNAMTADQRTKAAQSQPAYQYQLAQAQYNNNKANGKLTTAEDIKAQQNLATLKAGSTTDKDTRDLYGLSNAELYNYVSQNPDGKAIAAKVINYGDALAKAGVISQNKFKDSKGNVTLSDPSSKSTSTSKKSGKLDYTKQLASSNASTKALRALVTKSRIHVKQPKLKVA